MESKCNALAAISDVRDFCHFTWQHGRTLTRLHVDGGQTIEDWDFGAFVSALPESDRRPLLDSLSQSLKSGQDFENMLHLRDTCLDDKSFLVKCRPSGDDAIQCALMNVSLLWAREEQTQILLDEFAHRIKNNMTVVQSIARRTLNEARTVKEAAEIFDGRLSALAHTHDLLVRQNWCGAALHEVVSLAIMPFDRKPSPFRVSGGAIILPSRLTKAMALTIHELCTNAVKYGALSTPKGWIEITWHIQMHAGCEHLFFSWQEMNGPQIEVPPRSKGFGTRIIADWLSREAAGQGQLDYRPEGLRFHLCAPYPCEALSGQ